MNVEPKAGDLVLSCGHAYSPTGWHWWRAPEGVEFERPDGSEDISHWFSSCSECFIASKGDPKKIDFKDDFILDKDPVFNLPQ